MFEIVDAPETIQFDRPYEIPTPDILSYDVYALQHSGGKDSMAALLACLEAGIPRDRIELHHQLVDGRESTLMDWECSAAYVQAVAKAFGIPIYESWRVGGLEREILRDGTRTAPVSFEMPDGSIRTVGGERGPLGTRRKFPQLSASLTTRFCSAVAKIDVFARVMTNDPRFKNKRTLVITGERAEESSARAAYLTFEPHRTDLRNGKDQRHVDHWRPVHGWSERRVWEIIEKWKVNPHPAYHLGWGRTSCKSCIFGNKDQWATIRTHMPDSFERIANYEQEFKVTIHRSKSVSELADQGTSYPCSFEMLQIATSREYNEPIFVENWKLPAGAFKECGGPT